MEPLCEARKDARNEKGEEPNERNQRREAPERGESERKPETLLYCKVLRSVQREAICKLQISALAPAWDLD